MLAWSSHLETVLIGTPQASPAGEVRGSIKIAALALIALSSRHHDSNAKPLQVARPTPENSLAQGMVGTVWSVRAMGDDLPSNSYVPHLYFLEHEGFDNPEKVAGLLFTEVELEPFHDQHGPWYFLAPPGRA